MFRRFALAVAALALVAPAAHAKPGKKKKSRWKHPSMKNIEHPADAETTPAHRYGMMSRDDCEAELTARSIPFQREEARGVYAPVRLTGPLHGVTFRTNLEEEQRATTSWEIADCRLVLALDDFAQILATHDIVDVRHYSMYRAPSKSWPEDKIGTRHNGAVAIDAARFIASDGTYYDVLDHFSGRIDAKTCGQKAAPRKKTKQSLELRAILCEAVDAHLFNIVLTPNYNRAHRNHFHLEVTGAQWFLVH